MKEASNLPDLLRDVKPVDAAFGRREVHGFLAPDVLRAIREEDGAFSGKPAFFSPRVAATASRCCGS